MVGKKKLCAFKSKLRFFGKLEAKIIDKNRAELSIICHFVKIKSLYLKQVSRLISLDKNIQIYWIKTPKFTR